MAHESETMEIEMNLKLNIKLDFGIMKEEEEANAKEFEFEFEFISKRFEASGKKCNKRSCSWKNIEVENIVSKAKELLTLGH